MTTVVGRTLTRTAPLPRGNRFTALVAIQHAAARDVAVRILRAMGASDVVAASTVAEARRAALAHSGELGIVEAGLPDGSGVGLVRDLRAAGWGRTVVLCTAEETWAVRAALTSGVRCFLALTGRESSRVAMPVAPEGLQALSAREVEVLQLVAEGQSNRDVGESLGLSALTVKSHLARIARKVGTGDRAEMVLIALRAGVIS